MTVLEAKARGEDPVPDAPAVEKRARRMLEEADSWGDQLAAVWVRLYRREKKVVREKVSGTKARMGTRFWDPPPLATETKALKVGKWVDKDRWLDELEEDIGPVFARLYSHYLKRGAALFEDKQRGRRRAQEVIEEERRALERLTRARISQAREYHEAWLDRLVEVVDDVAARETATMEDVLDEIEVRYTSAEEGAESVARSQAMGSVNEAQLEIVRRSGLSGRKVWFCFASGTRVASPQPSQVVERRRASGAMVTIRTAAGRVLSVTPNHPILTRQGWVPAAELQVGDQLVCDGDWIQPPEEPGSGPIVRRLDPDVKHAPPVIDEVFRAAAKLFPQGRVVRRVPDFYSDSPDCEVEVVPLDGDLVANLQAPTRHLFGQGVLVPSDEQLAFLAQGGAADQDLRCRSVRAALDLRRVRLGQPAFADLGALICGTPDPSFGLTAQMDSGSHERAPNHTWMVAVPQAQLTKRNPALVSRYGFSGLSWAQFDAPVLSCYALGESCLLGGGRVELESQAGSFSDAAQGTLFPEPSSDRLSAGPDSLGQRSWALTGQIVSNEFADVEVDSGSSGPTTALAAGQHMDTAFFEAADHGVPVDTDTFSDLSSGLPASIVLDELVDIQWDRLEAHAVYDLVTESGWLVANGIISHNSSMDERVRPAHRKVHGQRVDLDEPFKVPYRASVSDPWGDVEMQYPGDRSAPPGLWIRCRCVCLVLPATSTGEPESGLEAAAAWVDLQHSLTRDITGWLERKGVRRVRTPEGARRYNQPIGSVIRPDLVPDLSDLPSPRHRAPSRPQPPPPVFPPLPTTRKEMVDQYVGALEARYATMLAAIEPLSNDELTKVVGNPVATDLWRERALGWGPSHPRNDVSDGLKLARGDDAVRKKLRRRWHKILREDYGADDVTPEMVSDLHAAIDRVRGGDRRSARFDAALAAFGMPNIQMVARQPHRENPVAHYDRSGRTIRFFDNSVGDNLERNPDQPDDAPGPGTNINARAWESVFRHEFGHHVQAELEERRPDLVRRWQETWSRIKERNKADFDAAFHADPLSRHFSDSTTSAILTRDVSYYAMENEREGFAETFAAVTHPEFDRDFWAADGAQELFDLMEEILDETTGPDRRAVPGEGEAGDGRGLEDRREAAARRGGGGGGRPAVGVDGGGGGRGDRGGVEAGPGPTEELPTITRLVEAATWEVAQGNAFFDPPDTHPFGTGRWWMNASGWWVPVRYHEDLFEFGDNYTSFMDRNDAVRVHLSRIELGISASHPLTDAQIDSLVVGSFRVPQTMIEAWRDGELVFTRRLRDPADPDEVERLLREANRTLRSRDLVSIKGRYLQLKFKARCAACEEVMGEGSDAFYRDGHVFHLEHARLEVKGVLSRVRSWAGVRRYKQPIGSIIRPDAPDLPAVDLRTPSPSPTRSRRRPTDFSAWGDRAPDIEAAAQVLSTIPDPTSVNPADPDTRAFFSALYDATDLPSGLSVSVTATHQINPGRYRVHAAVTDQDGNEVGLIENTVDLTSDPPHVLHGLIDIDHRYQGQGFGERYLRHQENTYIAAGVGEIRLLAGMEAGGYAWARLGFDWAPSSYRPAWSKVTRNLEYVLDERRHHLWSAEERDLAAEMLEWFNRAREGEGDPPTPNEVAQLGRGLAGPRKEWIGKWAMRVSEWQGVKKLVPVRELVGAGTKAWWDDTDRTRHLMRVGDEWYAECEARDWDLGNEGVDWNLGIDPQTKHLPGLHDQESHGRRGVSSVVGVLEAVLDDDTTVAAAPDSPDLPSVTNRPIGTRASAMVNLAEAPAKILSLLEGAMAAADQVHGLGDVNVRSGLPVRPMKGGRKQGHLYISGSFPREIRIRASGKHPGMTMLHEYAHLIDFTLIQAGHGQRFASWEMTDSQPVSDADPPMVRINKLLRSSEGARRIRLSHLGAKSKEYFASEHERFARAYAQWVAIRSQDPELMRQLRQMQAEDRSGRHHGHWDDDDFEPIAAAFDDLFRDQGWRE